MSMLCVFALGEWATESHRRPILCRIAKLNIEMSIFNFNQCYNSLYYQFIVGLTNSIPKQTMLNFTGKGIYVSKRLVADAKNGRNLKMDVIT